MSWRLVAVRCLDGNVFVFGKSILFFRGLDSDLLLLYTCGVRSVLGTSRSFYEVRCTACKFCLSGISTTKADCIGVNLALLWGNISQLFLFVLVFFSILGNHVVGLLSLVVTQPNEVNVILALQRNTSRRKKCFGTMGALGARVCTLNDQQVGLIVIVTSPLQASTYFKAQSRFN